MLSFADPNRGKPVIMDEIPRTYGPASKFSIDTVPTGGMMSPAMFLAQAIGGVVGSLVGGKRGGGQNQMGGGMPSMPDPTEFMQREETNRLLREFLKRMEGESYTRPKYETLPDIKKDPSVLY